MSLLDPPVRSTRSILHHDFSNKANGALSNTLDSGQVGTQWTLSTTGGVPDKWDIVGGRATLWPYGVATPTSDGANHAVYFQRDLGAPVTHVKVPVKWPAGSAGGSQFTIVLPSSPWGLVEGLPRAGVHVGFASNGQWNAQEWNAGVRNYATDAQYGRFTPMFTDGEEGTFELFIDHTASTLTIVFPDGKVVGPIYDASIALYTSSYVVFELFVSSVINDIPPSFGQWAADTLVLPYDSRQLTLLDIVTLLGAGDVLTTASTTTSATPLVLTKASARLQSFNGLANQEVVLPPDCLAGFEMLFSNASTGTITIKASNGSTLGFVFTGAKALISSTANDPVASSQWTAIFPVEVALVQTLANKTITLGANTITGTTAQFNTALTDGDFATKAGTETLTNKTIDLASNTFTMTKAQLNTAVSDADVATLTGSETLTNKTLTAPVVNSPTGIVKGDVGLGNVDNTSNATERAAAATLTNKTISAASNTLSVRPNEVGQFWTPPGFSYVAANYYFFTSSAVAAAVQPTNNRLMFAWVVIPKAVTISSVFAEVTVVGAAGSVIRLGIYNDDGNFSPGTLVADWGTIAGDSATVQEITGLSTVLPAGAYWIASVAQSAGTVPTWRAVGTSGILPSLFTFGTTLPVAGAAVSGKGQASVTGTLPSTATAALASTGCARMGFKAT